MPPLRFRFITPYVRKCLAHSPLVGILGHRQVGKTTLLSQLAQLYYTLDDEESVLYSASAGEFIKDIGGKRLVAIDEAQLMPSLFPALKEYVRKNPKPGQFLLSGSVRFTSLKAIRESLTGRIILVELLPLSINELAELEPAQWLSKIHEKEKWDDSIREAPPARWIKTIQQTIRDHEEKGGLPGICFSRNDKIRTTKLRTQIRTLLDRDLREVFSTKVPLNELLDILRGVAQQQGHLFKFSNLPLRRRINSSVLQNILGAMESLFLIRNIPIEGDSKGSSYFFEDLAEYRYLLNEVPSTDSVVQGNLFHLARSALNFDPEKEYQFFQYRTRGGVFVPIAIRRANKVTGLIPILESEVGRRELSHARAFLAKYSGSKVIVVSSNAKEIKIIEDRIALIPQWLLCW